MTDSEIVAAEIRSAEVPMSDALAGALDRLERDAERYRWLRGGYGSAAAAQHEEAADKGWERVNWLYDEDVDAVIDAEMAASPAVGDA